MIINKQPRSIAELKALCADMDLTLVRKSYAGITLVTFQQELDKSWIGKTTFQSYVTEIMFKYFGGVTTLPIISMADGAHYLFKDSTNFKYFKKYLRRMYNNCNLILFGYSVCNPNDNYNFEYGLRIAVERLLSMRAKQIHDDSETYILRTIQLDNSMSYLGISILQSIPHMSGSNLTYDLKY